MKIFNFQMKIRLIIEADLNKSFDLYKKIS